MSNYSTFISEDLLEELIKACGHEVREFLSFVDNASSPSKYSEVDNNQAILSNIEQSIIEKAKQYQLDPELFSDQSLVSYGSRFTCAVEHPVRIEVRRIDGVSGAAQIAVRGVYGCFREVTLSHLKSLPIFKSDDFYLRVSGNASFEINVSGVDKALPIKYLSCYWSAILDQMRYTPGEQIDSRNSKTIVAADGDGTTFDSPKGDTAPDLKSSSAYISLINYLELGGIYIIISGNNLQRTVSRVKDFIPNHLQNRILISANGGANLVYFDNEGDQECLGYRDNATKILQDKVQNEPLDIIYLGDDGRETGNDREAFAEVGYEKSILVAKEKKEDTIAGLGQNYIGQLVVGTNRVLEYVNQWSLENPKQTIFTNENIKRMVQYAVQS